MHLCENIERRLSNLQGKLNTSCAQIRPIVLMYNEKTFDVAFELKLSIYKL